MNSKPLEAEGYQYTQPHQHIKCESCCINEVSSFLISLSDSEEAAKISKLQASVCKMANCQQHALYKKDMSVGDLYDLISKATEM